MARVFIYGLAAVEAALLLFYVGDYAFGPGTATSSGGPEMALFFLVLAPLAVLGVAVAIYHFARSRWLRGGAVAVIVAPLLGLAFQVVDAARHQTITHEDHSEASSFTGAEARVLADAIVAGDATQVAAAAGATDVNQAGKLNQAFLGLAMTRLPVSRTVVKALLDAGADPNQGQGWPLTVAIGSGDEALVQMLLDAGADPNMPGQFGSPVFFRAMEAPVILAGLLVRGARIDAVDGKGWTALMHATWDSEWPIVTQLLAAGANTGHLAPDGTGLAKAIAFARYRTELIGKPPAPELLALEAHMRGPIR